MCAAAQGVARAGTPDALDKFREMARCILQKLARSSLVGESRPGRVSAGDG
jgi:hypothetical protein